MIKLNTQQIFLVFPVFLDVKIKSDMRRQGSSVRRWQRARDPRQKPITAFQLHGRDADRGSPAKINRCRPRLKRYRKLVENLSITSALTVLFSQNKIKLMILSTLVRYINPT